MTPKRIGRPPVPLEQRFWKYVQKTDGCWLWLGAVAPNGYGKIGVVGKHIGAHRVAWMLAHGESPSGFFVCHKCDNPRCVNPLHLFLGSAKDNKRDAVGKNRHAAGERHGESKLTDTQVREAKQLRAQGVGSVAIAKRYGVTCATISKVVLGQSWKHVNA